MIYITIKVRRFVLSIKKRWLPILLSMLFVMSMVNMATFAHNAEFLFPEASALVCGAWIYPTQVWNTSRPRMLFLMTSAAVLGVLLNLYLDAPVWLRATLAFLYCAVAMQVAAADMTPMVSAAILPILLGTTSFVYPAVVFFLVLVVVLVQMILVKAQICEPHKFESSRPTLPVFCREWALRLGIFAVLAIPAYAGGATYLAIPPLLVAFCELSRKDHVLRLHPWAAWLCLTGAAVLGAMARTALELNLAHPVLIAGGVFLLLVLWWSVLKVWFPPAGAVVLLAFIIPWQGALIYVGMVCLGAALWTGVALTFFEGLAPVPLLDRVKLVLKS